MKFKMGVSDWTLTFNDGSEFIINTVNNENVLYCADGTILITINDCTIREDVIDKFKSDNTIKSLKQEMLIYTSDSTKEVESYLYENVKIKEINVNSIIKEFTIVSIVIEA